jgi:hypothetical protein
VKHQSGENRTYDQVVDERGDSLGLFFRKERKRKHPRVERVTGQRFSNEVSLIRYPTNNESVLQSNKETLCITDGAKQLDNNGRRENPGKFLQMKESKYFIESNYRVSNYLSSYLSYKPVDVDPWC